MDDYDTAPDGVVYDFFSVGRPNYSLELALAMHGLACGIPSTRLAFSTVLQRTLVDSYLI